MFKKYGLHLLGWIILSSQLQAQMTLEDALKTAGENNPEIQAQRQLLSATKAGFWSAISPESPKIFAEVEGVPENSNYLKDYEKRKYGIVQEFDFPLSYFIYGRKNKHINNQQLAQLDWTIQQINNQIKKKFVRILVVDHKINTYQEIEKYTEESFQKARFRVLAGESSPYDSLKLSVDRRSIQNLVLKLEREHVLAIQKLSILLGLNPSEHLEITGNLNDSLIQLEDINHADSYKNHPLVKQASYHELELQSDYQLAWFNLFPKIEIKAFQIEVPEASPVNYKGGEIGLSLPLWFFLNGQGEIRKARHLKKHSQWHRIIQENQQQFHILKAKSEIATAKDHLEIIQKYSLKEAEELVRIATISYESGEMNYLELAEALKTYSEVKSDYIDALYNFYASIFDLELAIGKTLLDIKSFK